MDSYLAGRRSLQPLAAAGSHGDRFDKFRVVTDGRGIGHLFWLGTGLTLEWKNSNTSFWMLVREATAFLPLLLLI